MYIYAPMYRLVLIMSDYIRKLGLVLFVVWCGSLPAQVLAQEAPAEDDPNGKTDHGVAVDTAEAGMLLPYSVSPRTDSQRGVVKVLGGYDTTRERMQFEAVADVTIWGPIAIRAGAMYGQKSDTFRPTIGLRVQALSQERQGIDLGFGAFYKPEGFTEAEGEIEVMVMAARRFGRIGTFANLVYGQDPEGRERDGELRVGALYAVMVPLQVGLDARLRFDLGSEEEQREKEGGAEYDILFGPTASYAIGPMAIIAHGGLSVYGTEPAKVGAVALLGVAGAL